MNQDAPSIDWIGTFGAVCARSNGALAWGLPEPWIHAELYAELLRRSRDTGWAPLPHEVPYVTYYPVQLPSESNRDWKSQGAIKWVDICLHHAPTNSWCWMEFKVRHAGIGERAHDASLAARDAYRKDVIGLVGFSAAKTAESWKAPDAYTRVYWIESLLKPHAHALTAGHHEFVAAYLQLDGELDATVWSWSQFKVLLQSWLGGRRQRSREKRELPNISVLLSPAPIAGRHSMMVCTWALDAPPKSKGSQR